MKLRYRSLSGGRCVGEITIPTSAPGLVVASATGDDKADALARCAAIAQRIASDPVMSVLMPTNVLEDLAELRMLAEAACHSPGAVRDVCDELGIVASGADASTRRRGRLNRNPKHKLATDLHAVAKKRARDDDSDDDGDDDGGGGDDDGWGDDAYDGDGADNSAPAARPRISAGRASAGRKLGDIVNGRSPEVAGFWDDVTNLASKAGDAAWQAAKDHRKELAMAAATAALGPAGGVAAGKAMDLITAAQQGHPEAAKAVRQVAAKSDAGDPKARLMATVIKREMVASAKQAAKAAATAQPDHAEETTPPDDEHHDAEHVSEADRDHGDGAEGFGS